MKKRKTKRLRNLIYYIFVLGCLIYGIGSITYATDNTSQPDAIITINQNGESKSSGDLFSGAQWYPGYQKDGVLRIINNYKNANLNDLALDVKIKSYKPGLNEEVVYNSFIDNMRLTIEKGNVFNFDKTIVADKSLRELLRDGIDFSSGAAYLKNSMDFKYTLKMAEAATDELESMSAIISFSFNVNEIIDNGGDDDNGGGGSDNNQDTIVSSSDSIIKPDGDLIDRMPGYIELNEMKEFEEVLKEIIMPFNTELLKENKEHAPRIYYWNETVEKWVALASYVIDPYNVMAINDGEYTGWFNVFGVIQPVFTDVLDHWAEPIVNRMNGLGIFEGYPEEGLIRTAQLDQDITRTEFATLIFRLLNINPDNILLEAFTLEEAKTILIEHYGDAGEIPDWVAGVIVSTTKAGLIEPREGNFLPNEPITREEAAVMVSKAFSIIEKHQSIDLEKFIDVEELPDWAKAALANEAVGCDFITRAEALTVLKRLFINGMGL